MSLAYDEIVSLGLDCRLAFNLRRTFGIARAFPFDWWVTPLPALVAFLQDPSLDKLYDPARLEPVIAKGGLFAIRNAHYDIELHHEFPRGDDGLVAHHWTAHIAKARERSAYLWSRLLGLPEGSRVLFARSFSRAERRALAGRWEPMVEAAQRALAELFPRIAFELLLIDPPDPIRRTGVMSLRINDPNKDDWRGTPGLWTDRLIAAGIAWTGAPDPDRRELTPEQDQAAYA